MFMTLSIPTKIAIKTSLMTASKYALYTLGGAVVAYLMNHLGDIHGSYEIYVPLFGMILKTLGAYFVTKAKELEILRVQSLKNCK
jgi:hypothetical protein